jgi:hypothetical protein
MPIWLVIILIVYSLGFAAVFVSACLFDGFSPMGGYTSRNGVFVNFLLACLWPLAIPLAFFLKP